MEKQKNVSANAARQARFSEKQRQAGKVKLTLWLGSEDAASIKDWLAQRKAQRNVGCIPRTLEIAQDEPLLMPKSGKFRTILTISRPSAALLTLKSADFDPSLRLTLKSLRGFMWKKPIWERNLVADYTPADDQAVEIGVKLLNAGYALRITDASLNKRIRANDYQPSPQRIVSPAISEKYGKKFKLSWESRDREVGRAIGIIQNVKMFPDGAYVPLLQFEAVAAIAEQFGFLFRPGVDDLMAEAEAEYARAIGVAARPKHHQHAVMPALVEQKPQGEIDAEFLDD